jgi:hypothetical protein
MRLLLIILYIFLPGVIFSQTADGYILPNSSDTIPAHFKVHKVMLGGVSTSKYYDEVETVDSVGFPSFYSPKDLKGFGFRYKSDDYKFFSKPTEKGKLLFMEVFRSGARTSIYQYVISAGGQYGSSHVGYTVEKWDGSYMFITNYADLESFIEKFKAFYADVPEASSFIEKKFRRRNRIQDDMGSVVDFVNSHAP